MKRLPVLSTHGEDGFSIHTIPFGYGIAGGKHPAALSAIADQVVQLEVLATNGLLPGFEETIKSCSNYGGLNPLIELGQERLGELRTMLQRLLQTGSELDDDRTLLAHATHPLNDTRMLLAVSFADYTDFYASKYHAERVGAMFRGESNALQPNWIHLPVGYHGRSSSIIPSGTNVTWPKGQLPGEDGPVYGPSQKLDFELEFGCITAAGSELGEPVKAGDAKELIGGYVLINDWSARDIQAWEYVPLGPFTAKNFATSVSPWIIHPDALEPFRVEGPQADAEPLPYLKQQEPRHFDVKLDVWLHPAGSVTPFKLCTTNTRHLYWSMEQMIAHQTVTGCNIRPGDLYASGTVSGPEPENRACLLELSENGKSPVEISPDITRTFLQPGDEVIITGKAEKQDQDIVVNFGEVRSKVEEQK